MARARFSGTAVRQASALLLTSTAMGLSSIAAAQDPPAAPPPAAAPAPPEAGDIIVTATKRSERLQDVPISIQALGTETLSQHQVSSFDDYQKLLPSVSSQSFGPGQAQLYFRGITSGTDGLHIGPTPATGTYLDEIPLTTIASTVDLHVYDIDRVEALAGPQGTLYGASSLSGTLRIITNKPSTRKFEAGYDLELNKFGKGNMGGAANGFVNIPLSERAAIRLVGFYEHDGGYIDNTFKSRTFTLDDDDPTTNVTVNNGKYVKKNFNDVDTYGGRIALKYDINDNWTVTPMVVAQVQKANGNFLYDPRAGDLKVHDFVKDFNNDKWYQAALTIQGKIGNWDLTYAGGLFARKTHNQTDYTYYTVAYDQKLYSGAPGYYTSFYNSTTHSFIDPTQRQLLADKYGKMSHELRISSPTSNPLRVTAGLFYQRQTDKIRADYVIDGLAQTGSAFLAGPSYVYFAPFGDDIFGTRLKRIDRDYAIFGELSYDIMPNLTFTGGVRGFKARNTLTGFSGFAGDTRKLFNGSPICLPTSRKDIPCQSVDKVYKQSGETHKLNLTWKPDRDRMIYATYSTGFRPGGNNRKPQYGPFKADTITNYEIGFKTSWLDRHLRVNGAFFYEIWDHPAISLARPGDFGVTSIDNVGAARSYGFEGDVSYTQGGLSLSGSGTYVNAKTTKTFCTALVTQDVAVTPDICTPKGTRLPVQPQIKLNLTGRYSFDIGSARAFVQAAMMYQSSTHSFLLVQDYGSVGKLPGFATFDFSAGAKLSNNMTIEAFIQNAFDKRGQLSRNTACATSYCGVYYRVYPIKPQIFGLKVGQKF
jgi:outer membrane receptor protein involved in Fe transport